MCFILFNGKLVLGQPIGFGMPSVIAVELVDKSAWYLASIDQTG